MGRTLATETAAPAEQVLGAVGNHDRCTAFRELDAAFKIPYVCDCITKLCRTQAEVNPNIRGIGQGEVRHRNYKRLKLGGGQAFDSSAN
jgi:hypothetical protein